MFLIHSFLGMQTLLAFMEHNGGIPESILTLAQGVQSADHLEPRMLVHFLLFLFFILFSFYLLLLWLRGFKV